MSQRMRDWGETSCQTPDILHLEKLHCIKCIKKIMSKKPLCKVKGKGNLKKTILAAKQRVSPKPTIPELLQVLGLDKVGLDRLKPPEELSDEHHHIVLEREVEDR